MDSNTHSRVTIPEDSIHLGRILLTSGSLTLAFIHASYILEFNISASPFLVGLGSGVPFGFITYRIVDGTLFRRLSLGILGLIASVIVVLDVTGQFLVLDGIAHWFGAVGMVVVSTVILSSLSVNYESFDGILYFFAGLICVGIATVGLYLEWTIGYEVVGVIDPSGLGLVLISGIVVMAVGLDIWDDPDSSVPRE